MDALGASQDALAPVRDAGRRADLVDPGAGRVDDDARAERRDLAGQQVAHLDPSDGAARVAHDLLAVGVVERPRAVAARRQDVLEAQPLGVDQQVVEVVAGAPEVARPDRRLERERVDRWQHAVALAAAAGCQPVVELEPDADLDEAARGLAVDRHQKGQRPDQVRRQPAERLAFAERLADQPEVEQLEIPETAVNELRRLRRCRRGEVGLLDERHRDATQGQIACDAGAGHATSDDDDVVVGVLERPGTAIHPPHRTARPRGASTSTPPGAPRGRQLRGRVRRALTARGRGWRRPRDRARSPRCPRRPRA